MTKHPKCVFCAFSPSWPNHGMLSHERWVIQLPRTPPQPPVPFVRHRTMANSETKSKCLKSAFFAAITSWAHHSVLSHEQQVLEHPSTPPQPPVPFACRRMMGNSETKSKCRTRTKQLRNACVNSSSSTHGTHPHMTGKKLSCWRPLKGHRIC